MHTKPKDMALILDGQKLFSHSFAMMLERYGNFSSCQNFDDSDEFMNFLIEIKVHKLLNRDNVFVFLGYHQEKTNGLSLLSEIRRISRRIKIIFVTSSRSYEVLRTIKYHQPEGIISKYSGLDTLLQCLHSIREGLFFVCPFIINILNQQENSRHFHFTTRELEILKYFSEGHTIDQTAQITYLSRHTIVAHRRNMMKKAECGSIAQLINMAKDMELI